MHLKQRKRPRKSANGSRSHQAAGPPKVHVLLEAYDARLTQLETAFNTNTKAFSDGVQMMEAMQEVFRRALTDVVHGRVRIVSEDCAVPQEPGQRAAFKDGFARIDWNSYLKQYIEELVVAEDKAKEQKAAAAPVLATADEDAPIIFGGDSP